MTKHEAAVVMAVTGTTLLSGADFDIFQKYCEKLLGRPIWTHELPVLADQIKDKAMQDLREICMHLSDEDNDWWISVTEGVPKDCEKILIFWEEHSEPMVDTAFWQKDAKRFDAQHWTGMEGKITHWRPLPEPPKEATP